MIITLGVGFITIVLFIIDAILNRKCKGYSYGYKNYDIIFGVSKFLGLIFSVGLLISILVINCSLMVDSERIEYQEKYKIIMAAIEKKENVVLFTSEISDYNGTVIKNQKLHNNPWVSWFYNDAYEDLPLIEVGEGSK